MSNPTTPRDGRPTDPDRIPVLEEAYSSDLRTESEEILPLVEETATVHKREVATGKVRVRTITDTIEELAAVDLQSESVEVTRVPIDRVVDVAPAVRTENDVVIVPVLEEVVIVQKQLVLKEELHVRRRVKTESVEVPVSLRKQRAIVERVTRDGSTINREETDR